MLSDPGPWFTRRTLLALSVAFAAACTLAAGLLASFFGPGDWRAIFGAGRALPQQLALGALFGAGAGAACLFSLLRVPVFAELRDLFLHVILQARLTRADMAFISLGAGFSEELLFRGALQPLIGIWWSSLLFIALHGYFNPRSWRVTLYGVLMLAVSLGLGLLCRHAGLASAVTAHTVVDVVILWGLHFRHAAGKTAP